MLGMNDNHAYCVSKAKMEWAFALDWCVHLQERQPATLEQACDGHNVVGDGACANLMVPKDHMLYGQSVLATNSYGSAEYRVVLGSGNIYNLNLLFEDRLFYALCY